MRNGAASDLPVGGSGYGTWKWQIFHVLITSEVLAVSAESRSYIIPVKHPPHGNNLTAQQTID